MSLLSTGELVSCGEDATVKVWKDGILIQTIVHPCVSVWTCVGMVNGDFCTGGSDAIVRVFTRSTERVANDQAIQLFDGAVKANQTPSGMRVGDIDVSKLPNEQSLEIPGQKEDQVMMINEGGVPVAYQWQFGQWQKIGSVIDSSNKKQYQGAEYDYVFDIDVHEGAQPLKLPYNKKDNPYMAAQLFIEQNELPQSYLEEIASFIEKNTEKVVIGAGFGEETMSDPYTGAGRYVPGQIQDTTKHQTLVFIPMVFHVIRLNLIIMHKIGITLFQSGKCDIIFKKLNVLNDKVEKSVNLTDDEMLLIETDRMSQASIDLLVRVIKTWNPQDIFPGT